jgi:hypothetical protein
MFASNHVPHEANYMGGEGYGYDIVPEKPSLSKIG